MARRCARRRRRRRRCRPSSQAREHCGEARPASSAIGRVESITRKRGHRRRALEVRNAHALEEVPPLRPRTCRACGRWLRRVRRARDTAGRHVEQQREVRLAIAVHPRFKLRDARERVRRGRRPGTRRVASVKRSHTTQSPRASAGRITCSGTPRAGEHEQRLGVVRHRHVQEHLAQLLAERRAAGLARRGHLASPAPPAAR